MSSGKEAYTQGAREAVGILRALVHAITVALEWSIIGAIVVSIFALAFWLWEGVVAMAIIMGVCHVIYVAIVNSYKELEEEENL